MPEFYFLNPEAEFCLVRVNNTGHVQRQGIEVFFFAGNNFFLAIAHGTVQSTQFS